MKPSIPANRRPADRLLLTVALVVVGALAAWSWLAPREARAALTAPAYVHRVDVNRADAAEISAVPGLGAVLAGRIVEDRGRNGRFDRVEDLERVRGIGPHTVESIRGAVRCHGPEEP